MENFKEAIAELLEVDNVEDADELENFEVWDSLTRLSIIAYVDENFNISISAQELMEVKTVVGLKKLVLAKQAN